MLNIGIILEANPLHNGHKYFIDQIKSKYPNSNIIAVTSTSFTMRGNYSLINKFDKINSLLSIGVNAVFELPFSLSNQNANLFGSNAVKILKKLKIDLIICGSECEDESKLTYFYNLENSQEFKKLFDNTSNKESLKQRYTEVLTKLNVDNKDINLFNASNFTLAYQYYKECVKSNIKLQLIKRVDEYKYPIASATSIRSMFEQNEDFSNFIPIENIYANFKKTEKNLLLITKYQYSFNKLSIDKEGINNYLKNELKDSNEELFSKFIDSACNKKYTKNHLRRTILNELLNNKLNTSKTPYLRLLGFDQIGKAWLNTLNKNTKSYIFSSPNENILNENIKKLLNIEINATKLYSLITENNIIMEEYKLPVKR